MSQEGLSRERIRQDILKLLQNNGHRTFRPKEIAKRLSYVDNRDYRTFRGVLEELGEEGRIAKVKGGRFTYRPTASRLEGVLSVHPDGFGFVGVEGEEQDYFVAARRMSNAIDGDRVLIGRTAPNFGDRRREAEILEVLERGRDSAVGTLGHYGSFGVVLPDDLRLTHDIYVVEDALLGAKDGDKVVVSIDAFEDRRAALQGRILKVIGPATDPSVQTLAVAMSLGVRADFSEESLREAESAALAISEREISGRLDLRDRRIFTIDPEDAKDYDDAIHIEALPDGLLELGVHIADVSHYVEEGSAIDNEARLRGTSVYLVDRVIPMLPERLSNEVCSLHPNEDRLAYSCIMRVTPRGEVKSHRLVETVIRSRHRMSYEGAQEILDGDSAEFSGTEIETDLRVAAALAAELSASRRKQGAIDFDLPDVRVVLDESGYPTDIVPRVRLATHRLIEEFMLLANRTVARALGDLDSRPFVYRVHEHPDRDRIKQLAAYVRAFGHELPHEEGRVSPRDLNRLLEEVKGSLEEPVIEEAALRAMARARYAVDNAGHYGLAVEFYTHFTSPIRRYPDLIVHRLAKRHAAGKDPWPYGELKQMCDHSSERERVATGAERASVRLKQVEYAAGHIGDRFRGVISGVSKFGVYVELDRILVEGMVHVRDMVDDYYEYDERSYALIGYHSGKRYRLGDTVSVMLAAARPESREIDLVFASPRSSRKKISGSPAFGAGRPSPRTNKKKPSRKRNR